MPPFWWVNHLTQEVSIPEVRKIWHICVFLGDWPVSHFYRQSQPAGMLTPIQVCQHVVKRVKLSCPMFSVTNDKIHSSRVSPSLPARMWLMQTFTGHRCILRERNGLGEDNPAASHSLSLFFLCFFIFLFLPVCFQTVHGRVWCSVGDCQHLVWMSYWIMLILPHISHKEWMVFWDLAICHCLVLLAFSTVSALHMKNDYLINLWMW